LEEHDKRLMGEELEPGGRPKAPGRLELLQRFINTHNHDFPADWDRIGTATKAQTWLRKYQLIGPRDAVSPGDARRLRELREALRALIVAHQHGEPDPSAAQLVRGAADRAHVRVGVDDEGHTALEPVEPGADGAVATLLGILHEAQLSGDWARMKGCRQCEYAFYDRSKNRSATWCSMSVCGNRTKNRTYYERRRHG
jgi:predicted RNA-binding Zn ribbon-like protein